MKKAKISLIISSALTIILGVIMIVNPLGATELICRIAGIIVILGGLVSLAIYIFSRAYEFSGGGLIIGLIELAFGVWITARPGTFVTVLGIILGCYIILHAFGTFQNALETRRVGYKGWWLILTLAVIGAILGIIIIVSPMGTAGTAMVIAGIFLVMNGVFDLIVSLKAEKAVRDYHSRTGKIETTGREKK